MNTEAIGKLLDFCRGRKRNYQLTFGQPAGQQVMIDLAKFCRANETCVHSTSDRLTYILEGRREVWLRIQQHLNLSSEQLAALFSGNQYQKGDEQ